ncbi:type I-E CRISPR-associated protein Cse2/CasB [Candidatus Poriferisocius sp.]|uniref:type I-E CRISPR-associated protein Cse2/CasB n=1 Tax=Candidatus Poriferisocius sp. TaxID=3101276 RepID=UPI003B01224D
MSTAQPRTSPYENFMGFVKQRVERDSSSRAVLQRSLRADGDIPPDALWILGGWLPPDFDRALIMARAAAWCAKYHGKSKQDEEAPGVSRQLDSVAAQLAHQRRRVQEETARRILELLTREGMSATERTNHMTRALEVCPQPSSVDWAQTISDLARLTNGGEEALTVRRRWYRAYHRAHNLETENQKGESPERKKHD